MPGKSLRVACQIRQNRMCVHIMANGHRRPDGFGGIGGHNDGIDEIIEPVTVSDGSAPPTPPTVPARRRKIDRALILRFGRYIVASVAASLVSAVTLALVYRVADAGPRLASIAAFLTGATVNFLVFRYWTWRSRREDGTGMGRDLARYSVVAVVTALIALGTTSVADWWARREHVSAGARTLLVEGSYFAAFGLMFVIKFLVLDRFVFDQRDARRSRHQVDSTTRA
jgi:putative flippase GtrA